MLMLRFLLLIFKNNSLLVLFSKLLVNLYTFLYMRLLLTC